MSEVNDEMQALTDYAIKSARERFRLELDFSEQSIASLESILEKIYWGFSGHTNIEGVGGLIYNTAMIWGSYLGEYIRRKWGGTWLLKGTDRIIAIKNLEFSPINLIYQKITNHPEYRLEDYLMDTEKKIYGAVVVQQQTQYVANNLGPIRKQIPSEPPKKIIAINKRFIYAIGGIGGVLLAIVAIIVGYTFIKTSGVSAVSIIPSQTVAPTDLPGIKIPATATLSPTATPTVTLLPTYTPIPTNTPLPTDTPSPTYTETPSPTPTETEYIPPPTRKPTATRTPTNTSIPTTEAPQPSPTNTPTNTQPPPSILSCEVNPSQVPAGQNTPLTFTVHFSEPGYGFTAVNPETFPGQGGCSADANPGNSSPSCVGSSGMLPNGKEIYVSINSSVGDCTVKYSSP